jgi:hypothetical protein
VGPPPALLEAKLALYFVGFLREGVAAAFPRVKKRERDDFVRALLGSDAVLRALDLQGREGHHMAFSAEQLAYVVFLPCVAAATRLQRLCSRERDLERAAAAEMALGATFSGDKLTGPNGFVTSQACLNSTALAVDDELLTMGTWEPPHASPADAMRARSLANAAGIPPEDRSVLLNVPESFARGKALAEAARRVLFQHQAMAEAAGRASATAWLSVLLS